MIQDFRGGRVLYGDVLRFLVLIDGEVVAVCCDFLLRDEEALLGALPLPFLL